MSRLPKPGERARILPSEAMDRWGATSKTGVVLDWSTVCIAVELDDAEGTSLPEATGAEGVVLCTISEVELEGPVEAWIGGTDAKDDERRER